MSAHHRCDQSETRVKIDSGMWPFRGGQRQIYSGFIGWVLWPFYTCYRPVFSDWWHIWPIAGLENWIWPQWAHAYGHASARLRAYRAYFFPHFLHCSLCPVNNSCRYMPVIEQSGKGSLRTCNIAATVQIVTVISTSDQNCFHEKRKSHSSFSLCSKVIFIPQIWVNLKCPHCITYIALYIFELLLHNFPQLSCMQGLNFQ